jgi:hypothetical protein
MSQVLIFVTLQVFSRDIYTCQIVRPYIQVLIFVTLQVFSPPAETPPSLCGRQTWPPAETHSSL